MTPQSPSRKTKPVHKCLAGFLFVCIPWLGPQGGFSIRTDRHRGG